MKGNTIEETVEFAGLTRHNANEMTNRAASIVGLDPEDPPETSFATAIRELKTASQSTVAWKVPSTVVKRLNTEALQQFNAQAPDGITAHQAKLPGEDEFSVFVETQRFQSFYSPEVLKQWMRGEFHEGEGADEQFADALWHVPTTDYTATNPLALYEPLEAAIRDEELGDSMFGEIRTRKRGGEVHMDILFDAFTVEFGSDAGGDRPSGGPIVLGIRTGYDFYGGRAVYAEGFAQDTACNNSIRAVTDRKTRRSVGNAADDVREWWEDILTQMDLMTDQLTEAIEVANGITVDLIEVGFAEPFDDLDDDLTAFYELSGFPSYLAESAAAHCESRADDPFAPTMWDLNSGATYALTHDYTGGENTSRMNQLAQTANDLVMNPAEAASRVERTHRQAIEGDDGSEQGTLEGESVHASVERFAQTLDEQRDEFTTRQDRIRESIVTDGGVDQ